MVAKNSHRIAGLSRRLADSNAAAAESMDSAVADGLPEPVVTIVIDTAYGRIVSLPLPESAAQTIKESIETGIERLQQLRIDTESGTALIPGNLLRQSLIRFCRGQAAVTPEPQQ